MIVDLDFVAQGLRISVPYVLAALGGVFSERGGVVNIALEGILLAGAFAFAVGAYFSESLVIAVTAAALMGLAVAALHAFVALSLRGDQIVSGIAINLLALGGTEYGLRLLFASASNSPRVVGFIPIEIPIVRSLPVVGALLGHPLVLFTLLAVGLGHVVLGRTVFGLRLHAVGEHPHAAESLGISVAKTRLLGVLISGVLAGIGGAYLAGEQHSFTSGMSAGRGFIALAAMIVGKWRPVGAALAGCLFGFAEAAQIRLQAAGIDVPTHLVQMIPYLVTLLVLAGFIGRSVPPAADGVPYEKEGGG
jgi:simple sugar transport system permease protein